VSCCFGLGGRSRIVIGEAGIPFLAWFKRGLHAKPG
jgi:hypothetical protein